ncbi:MAG: Flp family type IVb pilin [Alphaproteobacteria bacterium]|jgi:Flp pilus assembly pilin Flp|nr:Flp family type IVb pilin [Alphaproteobacteria bacterium]
MLSLTIMLSRCLDRAKAVGRPLFHDRAGATAIEYGLLLAGVGIIILVAVFAMGDTLESMFRSYQTKLANSYS